MSEETVHCRFCDNLVPLSSAERWHDAWVGPCCWDERLRSAD